MSSRACRALGLSAATLALLVLVIPAAAGSGGGFGNDGLLLGHAPDAMVVRPGGEIVLVAGDADAKRVRLWRLTSDGSSAGPVGSGSLPCNRSCHAQVVLDSAGRLVVSAGERVARFLRSGARDESFGTAGVTTLPGLDSHSLAISPDGVLVVAGWKSNPNRQEGEGWVARVLPDGRLDPGFGVNGVATLANTVGSPGDVAVQQDGKIIAGVSRVVGSGGASGSILRLGTNGELDESYGNGGVARVEPFGTADLELQRDGKLVAGGTLRPSTGLRAAVVRLLDDGQLDPSFGVGGISAAWSPMLEYDFIGGLVLQPGGGIVVVGTSFPGGGSWKGSAWFVHRLNSAGAAPSRPVGGPRPELINPENDCWGDSARTIAVQPDGKILIGGSDCEDYVVARYLPDLRLDERGPRLRVTRFPTSSKPVPIRARGPLRIAETRVRLNHSGTLTLTVRRSDPSLGVGVGPFFRLLPGSSVGSITLRSTARRISVPLKKASVVAVRLSFRPDALKPDASYVLNVQATDSRGRRDEIHVVLKAHR